MTKAQIVNSITRAFHKNCFWIKKHSPEILTVAGTVGIVTSTIMACKATTKLNFVMEETRHKTEVIHKCVEKGEAVSNVNGVPTIVPYSEQDSKKDLTIIYAQTGVKLVKLYGPAVVTGTFALGCFLAATNILRKRNIALAAAYATVDQGFKEYRGRVVERFGKELDQELRYNIKAKEVEETVVHEDGTEETVTKTVAVADPAMNSCYARFFDEYCTGWTKDAEANLNFLRLQQKFANQKLQAQGYLYLNDVYESLGIPKTKAGHVVGWILDEKNPVGDNYVDFGIYDLYNEQARDFVNGRERSILLDFNVDGNVWELMK